MFLFFFFFFFFLLFFFLLPLFFFFFFCWRGGGGGGGEGGSFLFCFVRLLLLLFYEHSELDSVLFCLSLRLFACLYPKLHSARTESTHKGVNSRPKYATQVQQQRPESPTVTLTWHACKYKVHKLNQRYILKEFCTFDGVYVLCIHTHAR